MSNQEQVRFPTTLFQCVDSYLADGYAPSLTFKDILSHIEMSEADFRDPTKGLDYFQAIRLLNLLATKTDTPQPALSALSVITVHNMGIGGIAVSTSGSLKESLEVGIRFHKLILPTFDIQLLRSGSRYILTAERTLDFGEYNQLVTELILGTFRRFADEITGQSLDINVEFAHAPLFGKDEHEATKAYSDFFGSSVKFNSTRSMLTCDAEVLDNTRLKHPNQILHNDAMSIIKRLDQSQNDKLSVAEKVRNMLIIEAQNDSFLDLDEISSRLNMSSRTLARKLEKDNIQFKTLSKEIKFKRAKHLLKESKLPIKQVATKVGYSNQDAFVRAFKAYTGSAPTKWKLENSG